MEDDDKCQACPEGTDMHMQLDSYRDSQQTSSENIHKKQLDEVWDKFTAINGIRSSVKNEICHIVKVVESVATVVCRDALERCKLGQTDIWLRLSSILKNIRNELFGIFDGISEGGVGCRHRAHMIIAVTGAHFKLVRNLCAMVAGNQNAACEHRVYIPIEEISTYLCSWLISTSSPCLQLKPHALSCVHYGIQSLANMMTMNSQVCNQLWPFVFKESDLVKQLLKLKDPKGSKFIVMWIFNCTVKDAARSQYLTSTKVGQELLRLMLEMLTQGLRPAADPSILDTITLIFNNMIELNLTRDVLDSICRSKTPGPSILDPVHVTFLKLVDEYVETKLREDSTKLPIAFDTDIFLTKCINKLVPMVPILLSPTSQHNVTDEARHQPSDQPLAIPPLQRLDHIAVDRNGLSLLLRIMSRLTMVMSPEEKCRLMLNGLVEAVLSLLCIADEVLPQQRRAPSPGTASPVATTATTVYNHGIYRFKVNLVSILGNLCASSREVQDEIRRLNGIPLILSQAHIDDCNPFLREYTILALRNLLEKNAENQRLVASLEAREVVDQNVLSKTGLQAFVNPEGKVRLGLAS